MVISLRTGMEYLDRDELLKKLVDIRYERNDIAFDRNMFRVRGDTVEICPAYWQGHRHPGGVLRGRDRPHQRDQRGHRHRHPHRLNHVAIYPATHYVTTKEKMDAGASQEIEDEMEERVEFFQSQGKAD